MDLNRMSLADLRSLNERVAAAITVARSRERDKLRAELAAMAASHGFRIADIFGASGKQIVAPKYRDRKTGVLWSGRGRCPRNFDRARAETLSPAA